MPTKLLKSDYLTVVQIAKKAKVSRIAVYRKIKRNNIPHQMLGHTILVKRMDLKKLGY